MPSNINKEIMLFARIMQYKFDANKNKKGGGFPCLPTGERTWKKPQCDMGFLMSKLQEERLEFDEAYADDNGLKVNALLEAADEANMLWMLLDNKGLLDDAEMYGVTVPTHVFPKENNVVRRDDYSTGNLRMVLMNDGDIGISIFGEDGYAGLEYAVSGGKSKNVLNALRALMVAIEEDNEACPIDKWCSK